MTDKPKLTDKQQRFVEFYCGEAKFNATQAAIKAGYSVHTAKDIACQNLAKLNIQEEISNFMDKATGIAEVTTEWDVKGLKKEAENNEDGSSHSARISAYGKLGEFTGGFDKNKIQTVHSGTIGLREVKEMSDEDLEQEYKRDE